MGLKVYLTSNHETPQACYESVQTNGGRGISVGGERTQDARLMINLAHQEYDVPTEPEFYSVRRADTLGGSADARVSPYGCGAYDVGRIDGDAYWGVERRPKGCIVFLAQQVLDKSDAALYDTVRHEMAHAINWYLDGVTFEKQRTHAEWLKYLDTYDAY